MQKRTTNAGPSSPSGPWLVGRRHRGVRPWPRKRTTHPHRPARPPSGTIDKITFRSDAGEVKHGTERSTYYVG
jgi:hypothetical protein